MVLRFASRIDPWDPIYRSTFRSRGKLYRGKLITILQSDNTLVTLALLSSTALLRYTWWNTRFDHAIITDGIHVTIIGTRSDEVLRKMDRFCVRQLRRWRNGEPQPVVERAIIARVSANVRCTNVVSTIFRLYRWSSRRGRSHWNRRNPVGPRRSLKLDVW